MSINLLLDDIWLVPAAFALFFIVDMLFKQFNVQRNDPNGRYFMLHVLCNAYVTIVHLDDVYLTYLNPGNAVLQGPTDVKGSYVILALHLYHIAFYRPLPVVDWVHHGVMVLLMLPLAVLLMPGPLLGHGAFFSSGLPGGLDYLMLALIKLGFMDAMTEKKWNVPIQTWVRAPGCLFHALLAYTNLTSHPTFMQQSSFLPAWAVAPATYIVILTFFWNGPFFQQRVVESYTAWTMKKGKE